MKVEVVIPVYNGFEETLACVESILEHTDSTIPIRIYDDASSAGDLESFLRDRLGALPKQIKLVRNATNQGFTKTVNRGLREASPADVVILNSDTVVTEGWIEKLNSAATLEERIGTVTPLTNNGVICSVPKFCEDNEIPKGHTLSEFAKLIERVSEKRYPEVPSCVGFCTYLTRLMLEEIGLLDEENFPRGYGEENDLSCRARKAGFRNIIADDTYIFHKGRVSFQGEQSELSVEGETRLRKLHPDYYPRVARFVRDNPLLQIHFSIHRELMRNRDGSQQKRVLHLLHNGPYLPKRDPIGGTERHVQTLISSLPEFDHWTLIQEKNGFTLENCHPDFSAPFSLPLTEDAPLLEIIDPNFFDLVHVHHTRWFDRDKLLQALKTHGSYIVSLHDFVALCPRFHLFTIGGEHCTGSECLSACGYSDQHMESYRRAGKELLASSKQVIAFSENTIQYVEDILCDISGVRYLPHPARVPGNETGMQILSPREELSEELIVLTYAPVGKHKGQEIFRELFKLGTLPSGKRIRWEVLGDWQKSRGSKEHLHGSFSQDNLREKIVSEIQPDVALLFSLCPETYGLSYDEILSCGVPLVVGPLGAPAERIEDWGAGWVLDELSTDVVLATLEEVAKDSHSRLQKAFAAAAAPIRTLEQVMPEYRELYLLHGSEALENQEQVALQKFVARFEVGAPRVGLSKKLSGALIDRILVFLESLGLRAPIQRFVQNFLGERPISSLKNLRG